MANPVKKTPAREKGKELSIVKQKDAKTVEKEAFDKMKAELHEANEKLKRMEAKKPISVADAIVKANHIKALEERLTLLEDAKKSISKFALSGDSLQETMMLKGAEDNSFQTNNHDLIKQVKAMISDYISKKEESTRAEIMAMVA